MRSWAATLGLAASVTLWGLSAPVAAAPFADYHPTPLFAGGASATSFYLPMRDGVRLAVKLYRPMQDGKPAPGRFPVIWHATLDIGDSGPDPHPVQTGAHFSAGAMADDPSWEPARDLSSLTRHGYVVAIVARRGSGASFGRRRGYEDLTEAEDSYEVTEWLARQPWSTGAVGVYGCSNTGEAAMHVLTVRPPHLKAVWAGCFSFNRYDGFTRGGIIANWGAGPQRTLAEDLKATPVEDDADHRLLAEAAAEHQGSTYLLDLMRGMPYRDSWSDLTMSRFWAEASVSSYLNQMRASGAALYIQGGWRDDFREQGLIAWANYLPGRRYIILGDWFHCSNAGFDLRSEQLRFFDRYLKGIDTGIEQGPPIHYALVGGDAQSSRDAGPSRSSLPLADGGGEGVGVFPPQSKRMAHEAAPPPELTHKRPANTPIPDPSPIEGEGRPHLIWKAAYTWPVAGEHPDILYLAKAGALDAQPSAATSKTALSVRYDVTCPGASADPHAVVLLQPCHSTVGATSWTGRPLARDLTLTGSPTIRLKIASSQPDARVFAYLEDVAPDGAIHAITDARLDLKLRTTATPPWENLGLPWHPSNAADAAPMPAGVAQAVRMAFLPVAYVLKAGHRVQVTLAGADYRERVRPETSNPPVLTFSEGGGADASALTLPVVGGG